MGSLWIAVVLAVSPPIYHPRHLIIQLTPSSQEVAKASLQWGRVGDAYTLVGTRLGIPEIDALADRYGVKEVRRLIVGKITPKAKEFGLDRYYLLIFDHDVDAWTLKDEFARLSSVESAEVDELKPLDLEPNDPLFGPDYWTQQWHHFDIHSPEGWDITTGDPTIVVGPVDSGVDWDHPDIFPNLWVNPGEDLNGNGVFDYPADLNGVDDDGNGYIDDVIGFNFMSYNWNPNPTEPGNDHGTHVFGIAVAATNNGIGVAGVGWNVKGMAFKCGDGQFIYISAAVNAIYYAANQGAVATNHSYGSYNYNGSENSAMQYAHSMGVTICAAAGNDNSATPHYPSAYPNVIAVAASARNGIKADFSNYGTWVDVIAPGTNILSTVPGGNYMQFDGTSMASPIVTGLAGLIRSLHPSWNAFQVDSAIMWGAVNVDDVNPGYEGMLGWGLVNVYQSLALGFYAYPWVSDYWFDGDGRPEPGETVQMTVKAYNHWHWQDATNLTLTLSTDDPDINITDPTITIGTLANGDTVVPSDVFEFQVSGVPRFVNFVITFSSTPQPAYEAETLRVLIGYPAFLLVDDAGTSDYLSYYEQTLEQLGLVYEVWRTQVDGVPDLLAHPRSIVFWFTGDETGNVLTSAEQNALIDYLNAGGYLILSSQNLGEDAQAQSFMTNYLKATVQSTGNYYRGARGYDGDPIGDSVLLKLYGSGSAGNSQSCDVIQAIAPADTSLYFTSPTGGGNFGPAMVKYDAGTYKTIFMSFPFEAITSEAAGRTTREELLARMMSWLGVGVEEKEPTQTALPLLRFLTPITKDHLVFVYQTLQPIRIQMYDVSGRSVLPSIVLKPQAQREVVPVTSLKPGLYFLRVEEPLALQQTFRVIKIQ